MFHRLALTVKRTPAAALGARPSVRRLASRLTAQRVRSYAVVLAAAVWIVAAVILATPGLFDRNGLLKGMDFLQFHAAAYLVMNGLGDHLYDWPHFASVLPTLAPGIGDLLYVSVYPPQLAILLAPLGRLGYLHALALWTCVSACCYMLCARSIWNACPALRRTGLPWALLAVGFVPFHQLILHGQVSALLLVCLTGSWYAMRRERSFWAGFWVGSLAFKPPFLVAALLMMIASRDWRVLAGAVAGVGAQVGWNLVWLGVTPLADYAAKIQVLLSSPEMFEPRLWKMHSARAFFGLLVGDGMVASSLTAVACAATIVVVVRVWAATRSADLRAAALVLGALLLNPHVYVYDLVVLILPFALVVDWVLAQPQLPQAPVVRVLVHLLCWLPLISPVAAVIRIQPTTIAMAALLWTVSEAVSAQAAPAQSIVRR